VCHNDATSLAGTTCVSCHFEFEGHYDTAKHASTWVLGATCGGAGCHEAGSADLMGVHNRFASFSCLDCHDSARADVVSSIADGRTACDACHAGVSQTETHRAIHLADPPLVSGGLPPVPAYSYGTGSVGTNPTTDCIGCHTSNLVDEHLGVLEPGTWTRAPRTDALGTALTCASCHASTDARVTSAIALGESSCESCHVVHGPIPATHASTFVADPAVPCGDCHSSDLAVLHNGGFSVTTPGGTLLTGCALCHGYFEGARGATVQAAIDGNQRSCTACHAAGHPDLGGHVASASPTCAGCHAAGDVRPLHANRVEGECAVCHDNGDRVASIATKTAECASCHAPIGAALGAHAGYGAAHVSTRTDCSASGCHAIDDVAALHANASTIVAGQTFTGCAVCHRSPTDQPSSTDCVTCHATDGVDYHTQTRALHQSPTMDGCFGFGCHGVYKQLPDVHAPYVGTGKPYATTCDLCHRNADSERIDWALATARCTGVCHDVSTHEGQTAGHLAPATASQECMVCHAGADIVEIHPATVGDFGRESKCATCHNAPGKGDLTWDKPNADCAGCHDGHGDLTVAHTAVASSACLECHENDDVRALHSSKGCASCHKNPAVPTLPGDVECISCHAALSPADPAHYGETSHTASALTGDCSKCHKLSMKAEHAKSSVSPAVTCVSCHESKVDAFTAPWSRTCAECHPTTHGGLTSAHRPLASSSCAGTGCHAITDVAALHAGAQSQDGLRSGCFVCHTSDAMIPSSAECGTCHDGHGDLTVAHAAVASGACTACHETGDVRAIHATKGCASCHGNPAVPTLPADAECSGCHGALAPVDPSHYPTAAHAASETGCSTCHYSDLKAEHFKSTVSPAVTCISCHETKVDQFAAAWDKTCAACHATRHAGQSAKHASTNTSCGGTGCHVIADVSDIHKGVQGGGCQVCHAGPASSATGKTDCSLAGCHAGMGTSHHVAHDAASVIDPGCKGCHFTYLDDEHAALGYSCATCHGSANAAVKAAIANGVRACGACHPAVNGRDRHAAQNSVQFNKGNSSGHRAYATLPFMKTSFAVNGTTYTWSAPTNFLKTGWTTSSMVTCDKCHSVSSTAVGPHGSSVKVNMDPAYPTDWKTVYLNNNGASSSSFICAKCHQNFGSMNDAHSEEDHEGSSDGKCIGCHTKVPHSWRLPRLLAYKDDPAPYNSLYLTGIRLKNYTPTSWSESDCSQSGCDEHSSSMSNRWPSAVQTVGTLGGTVESAAGVGIVGATVTTDKGQSTTTDASGAYSFGTVATGAYNVTASATGYTPQTKAATVAADQAASVSFSLTAAPVNANLAIGKAFTASRTYSSTYAASKAGDDDTATYWRSGSTSYSSDWLKVDLGSSQMVQKVEVAWASSRHATNYTVQVSTDNSSWTQVYSTTSGGSGTAVVTFASRNARYVRVNMTRAYSSSNGYGVAELRVFK